MDDALAYLIFLSDLNRLFDVALGTYNLPLALAVAQKSQKVFMAFSSLAVIQRADSGS